MKHKWKGQQLGGSPVEETSTEWICYCDNCGTERNDDNKDEVCIPVSWSDFRRAVQLQDPAQVQRAATLLRSNKTMFLHAYREEPIVYRSIQVALDNGLREEDAWLLAVIGLLEENRKLFQNAQTLTMLAPPPIYAPERRPIQWNEEAASIPLLTEEHYLTDDAILPSLTLPNPCEIRIAITASHVSLAIGQRDFSWKRGCPDLSGAGTFLDSAEPDR